MAKIILSFIEDYRSDYLAINQSRWILSWHGHLRLPPRSLLTITMTKRCSLSFSFSLVSLFHLCEKVVSWMTLDIHLQLFWCVNGCSDNLPRAQKRHITIIWDQKVTWMNNYEEWHPSLYTHCVSCSWANRLMAVGKSKKHLLTIYQTRHILASDLFRKFKY